MSKQTGKDVPAVEPDIWYVSYRTKIARNGGYAYGATRRFKSEAEAKQFANEVIKNGWSAVAGTINPYTPKRVIPPRQVLKWVADK